MIVIIRIVVIIHFQLNRSNIKYMILRKNYNCTQKYLLANFKYECLDFLIQLLLNLQDLNYFIDLLAIIMNGALAFN